ncbi:hypothetical protein SAMN05444851_1421 [Aliiroseovarius sediminilitoris]|uniref:Uncharacterized protein n=1 Tax=Aliiroseovarius sediminilitoris TaxID=1173584 RepID=A0A1I0P9W5_9RHOB|nr:hypothetical protein [Aliiroseovarius sediminilitoris]SEW10387.1 hypothetical protein SAMN05444851_1421 [Aliiroseovarius sediminilitoris]
MSAAAETKDFDEYLDDGYEIKSMVIDAGNYVFALQRGRKAAILHVDGINSDFLETLKSVEVGY